MTIIFSPSNSQLDILTLHVHTQQKAGIRDLLKMVQITSFSSVRVLMKKRRLMTIIFALFVITSLWNGSPRRSSLVSVRYDALKDSHRRILFSTSHHINISN